MKRIRAARIFGLVLATILLAPLATAALYQAARIVA